LDKAYFFIGGAFALSVLLGLRNTRLWPVLCLVAIAPSVLSLAGLGFASTSMLFFSLHLVGITILYTFIGLAGVLLGKSIRKRLSRNGGQGSTNLFIWHHSLLRFDLRQ
jgi:hypothetical protein